VLPPPFIGTVTEEIGGKGPLSLGTVRSVPFFVLRVMFWERMGPLFGPSNDLEESLKVSGFEQLFCFRAAFNPVTANCEAAWAESAFGWKSRAFSRQEAWGGRGWSVLLREPSALRRGVGWRVAAGGGSRGVIAGLTLSLGVGAVRFY